MRRAVDFEVFSRTCQYAYIFGRGDINGGSNCRHPGQQEVEDAGAHGRKKAGCCHWHTCPLGTGAEQQDLTDRTHPDAIKDEIDWGGECGDGEVTEGETLLVNAGEGSSPEEKEALWRYDRYMYRYDKGWLDRHGIPNSLCK